MTANELINAALSELAYRRMDEAERLEKLTDVNNMMLTEALAGNVVKQDNLTLTLTSQQSYDFGTDIELNKPLFISDAIYSDSSSYDRKLDIITKQAYLVIPKKTVSGDIAKIYYDYNAGRLYVFPIASNGGTLTANLNSAWHFATVIDELAIDEQYREYLTLRLAFNLVSSLAIKPAAELQMRLVRALRVLNRLQDWNITIG